MPKFSTKTEFKKILNTKFDTKTVYSYTKNLNFTLECHKTKVSIVHRKRIANKYQKKYLGTANGKTLEQVLEIFHHYIDVSTDNVRLNSNNSEITLSDYFFNEYVPAVHSYKRSIDQDIKFMQQHILPILGNKLIASITKMDIQTLIKTLAMKRQKPNTQRRFIYCLSAVLTHAVTCDIITTNPVHHIKKPSTKQSMGKVPEFSIFQKMLNASRTYHDRQIGCLITSAIRTGARLSEIKNSKWEDLDFTTMTWFFPITKSNVSRTISIPADLANDLKSLRELYPETVHIFESPITKKPIVKPHTRWKTFLKKNGFPDIRFHDLRHSFATYTLEQANFTLIELRDHLGHASVATTQIYTKASHKSTAKKLSLFMT